MRFENTTLGQLSIKGKGSYGISASAVPYSDELFTYLRITDINDDGTINKSGLMSVSEEKAEQYLLKPNDIVFARTGGSTGRNYFYDGSDGEFVFAGFLIRFSIDDKKVNPLFIKYYCQSQIYKDWVHSFNTGSTRGNINAQTYANMPIILPPREQQDLLVNTLSVIDAKIAVNKAINENLEQQAQAIFKSWFVDTQNEDRKTIRADEFFDISIGKTPPRKEHQWFTKSSNDIVWVSISDMGSCGLFIEDSSERLTSESIDRFNIKVVPANTVLLSFKLTVGRVAITATRLTTNEAIAHFKNGNPDINEYLYCYLKCFNYQSLGSTSSIAIAVNSKTIKGMPFIVPTDEEITNFHALVSPMFKEVLKSQRENQRLAALRDTLLPKLMNGEIDVSQVDI